MEFPLLDYYSFFLGGGGGVRFRVRFSFVGYADISRVISAQYGFASSVDF